LKIVVNFWGHLKKISIYVEIYVCCVLAYATLYI
jgi:hypothetical protein